MFKFIKNLFKRNNRTWINTKDQLPKQGQLIVKYWNDHNSIWAGRYNGTNKEKSFDKWIELPEIK